MIPWPPSTSRVRETQRERGNERTRDRESERKEEGCRGGGRESRYRGLLKTHVSYMFNIMNMSIHKYLPSLPPNNGPYPSYTIFVAGRPDETATSRESLNPKP